MVVSPIAIVNTDISQSKDMKLKYLAGHSVGAHVVPHLNVHGFQLEELASNKPK